jgi:hypothetical protein
MLVSSNRGAADARVHRGCDGIHTADAPGLCAAGRRQAPKEPAQNAGQKKPKVDEKAYKGALDSIPEKKADPWGKMR